MTPLFNECQELVICQGEVKRVIAVRVATTPGLWVRLRQPPRSTAGKRQPGVPQLRASESNRYSMNCLLLSHQED